MMDGVLQRLNVELAEVVETVRRSLVQIHDGRGGHGAGSVWHPDGLIVTNAHVVSGYRAQVVLADGRVLPADVVAHDPYRDLAALIVPAHGLDAIDLGDSRQLDAGAWVMALGHPWGVKGAVSAGLVMGVGANLPGLPSPEQEWIAVNLQLRPGHSGGPLVDARGRLVGINARMIGLEVGLAVPVNEVKEFLTGRRRP